MARSKVYPEFEVYVHQEDKLTAETAKELLGWEEPKGDRDFDNFLFRLPNKVTVKCKNNVKNRPFKLGLAKQYANDILSGNWSFNSEPIIIGEYGSVLSGQHRLIALVLADWIYQNDEESEGSPPTMACVINKGVSEKSEVVQTIDTGKSRSVADALVSVGLVGTGSSTSGTDLAIARTLQFAVKLLWKKLGLKEQCSKPSHSRILNFVQEHPGIIEACREIVDIEGGANKRITSKNVGLGVAAGALYLTSTSASDAESWHLAEEPSEDMLDMSMRKTAEEFWELFAGDDASLKALKAKLSGLARREQGVTQAEVLEAIFLTWNLWVKDKPVTAKDLKFKGKKVDGVTQFVPTARVGGLDAEYDLTKHYEEEEEEECEEEEVATA